MNVRWKNIIWCISSIKLCGPPQLGKWKMTEHCLETTREVTWGLPWHLKGTGVGNHKGQFLAEPASSS